MFHILEVEPQWKAEAPRLTRAAGDVACVPQLEPTPVVGGVAMGMADAEAAVASIDGLLGWVAVGDMEELA